MREAAELYCPGGLNREGHQEAGNKAGRGRRDELLLEENQKQLAENQEGR